MEAGLKVEKTSNNEEEVKVKSFKVFESDWTCKGFKYEVGKTYSIEGEPILCERGFHSCICLKDCFNRYPLAQWSKFAEVEASGIILYSEADTKIVSSKITIVKELFFDDIIKMIATNGDDDIKKDVINSPATIDSKNTIHSRAISQCEGINVSEAISQSEGVQRSEGIYCSRGITISNGVCESYGIYSGSGIYVSSSIHSSNGISSSRIVRGSGGLLNSSMITYSHGLSNCQLIDSSEGIHTGYGIRESLGINDSFGIDNCKGINKSMFLSNCEGLSKSLFCSDIKNEYFLFNKKVSKERFDEVNNKIRKLMVDWIPEPNNGNQLFNKKKDIYEQKASPALLKAKENMHNNIPKELVEYIKSLPEYNEEIFNSIVCDKEETENE